MKRLYAVILALCIMLSLAACKTDPASAPSSGTDLTQKEVEKILEQMEREEQAK